MHGRRKNVAQEMFLRQNNSEASYHLSMIKNGNGFRTGLQLLPKHMNDTNKPLE